MAANFMPVLDSYGIWAVMALTEKSLKNIHNYIVYSNRKKKTFKIIT